MTTHGDGSPPNDAAPSPEDPTRMPAQPQVAPLDEAPDGHTPGEPNEPSPESLPPNSDGS